MSNKSHFRGPFDKEHGKRAQALLKYASQVLHEIHWPLSTQLSWKKSLLFTWKILGRLVNTLATDEKYPVLNRENWTILIQMELSQKQMTFSQFFAAFFKSKLNFEYFDKKYDPHSFCISEITDCENVVREMSKKSRFRVCFDKQYGKRAHAMLKSESQYLYHIHFSLARKLFSKKSLLLTCQILGLCANTLATDKRYPVLNRENLTIRIQMQLSSRKIFFFSFMLHFWNLY